MNRRHLIAGLASLGPCLGAGGRARAAGRPFVGLLDTASEPARAALWAHLRTRLTQLRAGDAPEFVSWWGEGHADRMPALARDIVARNVDVIVTAGTLSALEARHATSTIPIVLVTSGDPVKLGLAASLARPGGNVTGLVSLEELGPKRLELVRELVPEMRRLAVLWNAASPSAREIVADARDAGGRANLVLDAMPIGRSEDFEPAFADASRTGAQAVMVLPSPAFFGERWRIAALALRHGLPLEAGQREYVEAGALVGYAASIEGQFRRAADVVHRVLNGASPATTPIEQPTEIDLVVNLRSARALGIEVPPQLLARATEAID